MQGGAEVPKRESQSVASLGQPRRKVFFFLDSLQVGGTETQAVELARRLDPAVYEVTLGCLRLQGPLLEKLQASAVKLREFHPAGGLDSPRGVWQLLRLAAFLRRERFDLVHTHDLWTNLMGVPAARLARVPVIISSRRDLAHFDWYQGRRRKWLRRIQNLSDVVLANAGPIRDALIRDDHFAPEKVRVIPNGVDVEKFYRAMRDRERLFPGIGPGKLIVLVGNMHSDVKGHPWLIEAATKIAPEFPHTRFLLVGSGDCQDDFARRVAELGLQKNFRFLGRRNDIPEILVSSDIAVLPSRAEGLPNAILEYMAAGLPVVASQVGGNPELVRDGETGLLVPPQDAGALAAALLRLLRDDPLASRLGQGGHAWVKNHFSFERLVEETGQLYEELGRKKCPANSSRP